MNKPLRNKYGEWAVVTGASSGIGAEFAAQLLDKGLNVVLVARSERQLNVTSESMGRGTTKIIVADLATQIGIDKLAKETASLDVGLLVHSAGVIHLGSFSDTPEPNIDELIQIHITATTRLTHIFAQRLIERKSAGGIVLLSSGFAFTAVPWVAVYAAAKAYVLSFGEALSIELKSHNIDVLTVVPGGTKTNMAKIIDRSIDLNKLPMSMGSAKGVAKCAINSLGKKDSVVPGFTNKMMAMMMNKAMSRNMSKKMIGGLLERSFRT